MRTGLVPIAGWGAALIGITLLGVLVFGLEALPAALLASAGAGAVLSGLVVGLLGRRRPRQLTDGTPRLLVESSLATFAVAAGFVVALVGAGAVGSAFLWPGLGLMALGLGGLVRERRAARAVLRAVDDGEPG